MPLPKKKISSIQSYFYLNLVQILAVADQPFVRLASSVGRLSGRKSEGCVFQSHMGLTFYLELKNSGATLNIMYIA